jgi:predicted acylesterase/phospholipase RssA
MPREHLTVCFSGGGFRAMLFHLGVVRALRDADLLKDVKHIFSVSGGSILAAHLVLNWERYTSTNEDTFRACGDELIKFAQSDVRGQILRRWVLFGWPPKVPWFKRTRQLVRHYSALYGGALLDNLSGKGRPELRILATNMVSGEATFFDAQGVVRVSAQGPEPRRKASALPVAEAVAASSAFPPMFPPVTITARHLSQMEAGSPGVLRMTDGGVFDNTGVHVARLLIPSMTLWISDASAMFDQATDQKFGDIVARTARTTDILMGRIAKLEEVQPANGATAGPGRRTVVSHIASIVDPDDLKHVISSPAVQPQPRSLQEWVKNVRTDLDYFSDDVVNAIFSHGYEVGLRTAGELHPTGFVVTSTAWNPTSRTTAREDRRATADAQFRTTVRKLRTMLNRGPDPSPSPSIDAVALAALQRAANRSVGLWNRRDALCWVLVVAVAAVVVGAAARTLVKPSTADVLGEPWQVIDASESGASPLGRRLDETGLSHLRTRLTDEAHAYRKQAGTEHLVTVLIASPAVFARPVAAQKLCTTAGVQGHEVFASAVLLVQESDMAYGRVLPVERSKDGGMRISLPRAPAKSTLALMAAAVGKQAGADPVALGDALKNWRNCDDPPR